MTHSSQPPSDEAIAEAIARLLGSRAVSSSICPSEVARRLSADEWRPLMPAIRRVAATMAAAGRLRITQGATEVPPGEVQAGRLRGAIRLRRVAAAPADEITCAATPAPAADSATAAPSTRPRSGSRTA